MQKNTPTYNMWHWREKLALGQIQKFFRNFRVILKEFIVVSSLNGSSFSNFDLNDLELANWKERLIS